MPRYFLITAPKTIWVNQACGDFVSFSEHESLNYLHFCLSPLEEQMLKNVADEMRGTGSNELADIVLELDDPNRHSLTRLLARCKALEGLELTDRLEALLRSILEPHYAHLEGIQKAAWGAIRQYNQIKEQALKALVSSLRKAANL